jgi:hypothetical protein
MEMNSHRASLMAQALCEAEGIDVSSVTREVQDQSPHATSDMPSLMETSIHDKDG